MTTLHLIAFLLTQAIEVPISWSITRNWKAGLAQLLINFVTHFAAWFVYYSGGSTLYIGNYISDPWNAFIVLEICIIFVEGSALAILFRKQCRPLLYFAAATTANIVTAIVGTIIL